MPPTPALGCPLGRILLSRRRHPEGQETTQGQLNAYRLIMQLARELGSGGSRSADPRAASGDGRASRPARLWACPFRISRSQAINVCGCRRLRRKVAPTSSHETLRDDQSTHARRNDPRRVPLGCDGHVHICAGPDSRLVLTRSVRQLHVELDRRQLFRRLAELAQERQPARADLSRAPESAISAGTWRGRRR